MKEKDTFIFKKEWLDSLEMLEKEEIMQLLRGAAAIQAPGDTQKIKSTLAGAAAICWGFMAPVLELNISNYLQTCEKNRKNGILGGRKKPNGPQSPPVGANAPRWPPAGADSDPDPEKKSSSSFLDKNLHESCQEKTDDDDDFFLTFSEEDQALIKKWEAEFGARVPLHEPDLVNKIRRMLKARAAGRLKIKIPPTLYLAKCVNDFEDLGGDDGSARAEKEAARTASYLESLRKSGPGSAIPDPKLPESLQNPTSHPCAQGADAAAPLSMPEPCQESQAAINAFRFKELRQKLASMDARSRPRAGAALAPGAARSAAVH